MQNDAGEFVDLYIPRKCSASNRIIHAKDHASIQINIAEVDEATGRFNGKYKTYAICGPIRRMGESDDCINRLAKKDSILAKSGRSQGGDVKFYCTFQIIGNMGISWILDCLSAVIVVSLYAIAGPRIYLFSQTFHRV